MTVLANQHQSSELSADGFAWNLYSPRVGTMAQIKSRPATAAYFTSGTAQQLFKSIIDKRICGRASEGREI